MNTCHQESIAAINDFVENAVVSNGQIPTGLVFGGMNASSDHEVLFHRIIKTFAKNGHAFAKLTSRDCPNLKSAMRNMIGQFMGLEKELEDENKEEMVSLFIKLLVTRTTIQS